MIWFVEVESSMIFKGIRKIHEGKFITRYDVDYIEKQIYNVTFINAALDDCGLPLLKTGLKS